MADMPSNRRRGYDLPTVKSRKSSGGKKGNGSPSVKSTTKSEILHCYFLELPAEVRNRIYQFAREEVYDECLTPPLLRKGYRSSIGGIASPSQLGTLSYRGFTQVCKQVRTEFRPTWLRQSCFHMKLPAVAQFITAYYPKAADYQNAPKLLLIYWDHGMTEDEFGEGHGDYDGLDEDSMEHVLTDITLLVRLRAHCPTFTAKFVSRRILEDDVPHAMCDNCGNSIYCTCGSDCDHADAFDQARWEMVESYQYLNGLNAFLSNSNDLWAKMLRDNTRVRTLVEFTFDMYTRRPAIFIRFSQNHAPQGFHPESMYSDSLILLNRLGMLDLKHYELLDYVVGEANGKRTRHLGEINLQVQYNQIHLDGTTIARWKEKEAKASIP